MLYKHTAQKLLCAALAASVSLSLGACAQKDGAPSSPAGSSEGKGASSSASTPDYLNLTGLPICAKPITVTVSGSQDATPDWNETLQVAEIEKQMGIRLECTPYATDAWATQLTLMMSSDSLPDLIVNTQTTLGDMSKYGMEGYFLPLNQYLDPYAPNIQRYFKEYPAYESSLASPDGNIYGLSRITTNKLALVSRTFIDQRWLDRVGIQSPKTIDALYEALKAFRDTDANGNGDAGDEIPFSGLNYYSERTLLAGFGIFTDKDTYILSQKDSKVALMDVSDPYKEYLKFMHKLYEEKLFDQESFIQTSDEMRAKIKEERVGLFGEAAPFVGAGQPISYDANFQWLGGLTSSWNETPTVPMDNQPGSTIIAAINAQTKYPEALVRLLDTLYSEEGELIGSRGFEGVTYEYVEIPEIPGSQVAEMFCPEGYASQEEFRYKKAVINNAMQVISGVKGTQYKAIMEASSEQLESILPKYGWAVRIEQRLRNPEIKIVESFPNLTYLSEETDQRATLQNDVTLYLKNAKAQFITGEVDIDTGWENHLKTLNQMGLEKLLTIEQAAYDRMK